jgi:hypothetical protein
VYKAFRCGNGRQMCWALLAALCWYSSQPELLRSVVARARLLRKQLDAISGRVQGIQVRQAS